MAELTLEHIYKKYENATDYSVKDFNLEIHDQEFIVFVGPSGCGKSTTLRMIAGLEDISDGDFKINTQLMNDVAPKNRDIAMVFQNYALYPHMSVFDNMAFGLKLRKYEKDEIKKRVENAAKILGLVDYLERKPTALSGGQRQRVALGRAIVRDAKVFLMDEPLSNLDAKLRVSMRAEIAKLHRRLKTTTIYVTHDQTEAMTMADRIVIMKDGLIQQVGTPKEVYSQPVNMFVASFIGSPAMNFFKVTYQKGMITNPNGFKLRITKEQQERLTQRGYEDRTLFFGIRPEDIYSDTEETNAPLDTIVSSEVVVSELLGAESMLYAKSGGTEFIAKVSAKHLYEPGTTIDLIIDTTAGHFFDPDTEEIIL